MSLEEQLLKLLQTKQFDACLTFIQANPTVAFDKALVLSKVYKKGKVKRTFWKSNLICTTAKILLKSEENIDLFHPLFGFKEPVNLPLLSKIWEIDAKLFSTLFKRFKCYQYNSWITALDSIAKSMLSHKRFYITTLAHESQMIKELAEQVDQEEQEDFYQLAMYPIDQVLVGVSFCHERLMQNDRIIGDNAYKTMYDVAIARVLNSFLKYHTAASKPVCSPIYSSNKQLQKIWEKFRPKHKTEIKKPITFETNPDFMGISKLVDRAVERRKSRYLIESFSANMCAFEGLELDSVSYNSKHELFRRNDSKAQYEESYFIINAYAKHIGISNRKFNIGTLIAQTPKKASIPDTNALAISKTRAIFQFYKIPFTIPNTKVDLILCYKILRAFSWYKAPKSCQYIRNYKETPHDIEWKIRPNDDVKTIVMNQPPEEFSKLFRKNSGIFVIDYKQFIQKAHRYWKQPLEVIKANLDFLIFDMNIHPTLSNWFHRPFIKVNDNVYWLGRILKDRRWDVSLREKLKADTLYTKKEIKNTLVQAIDSNLEKAISNIFKKQGFQSFSGWIFPHALYPNQEGGDIDVIAYKDQYLFIIQVKNGGLSDQIREASYIEDKQLMNQAAKQLDNSMEYIQNNWEQVKKKLEIEHTISAVTLYPLIVTNVYQGDLKLFKHYKKVSLFELHIIMNNLKESLYASIAYSSGLHNSNNPEYKNMAPILERRLDLWEGAHRISPPILIDCIDNNKVWKELDKIRDFS